MIGNVWEWTTDWYTPKHAGRRRKGLLHPEKSARRPRGGELRPLPARDPHPAQGAEGRLAPVRAQLLPALSAGRAPSRSRSIRRPATSASAALRASAKRSASRCNRTWRWCRTRDGMRARRDLSRAARVGASGLPLRHTGINPNICPTPRVLHSMATWFRMPTQSGRAIESATMKGPLE